MSNGFGQGSAKGVGIDLCSISRVRRLICGYDRKTLGYLFTQKEIELFCSFKKQEIQFAIAFSAKEAVGKALKVGVKDLNWYDTEILFNKSNDDMMQVILYGDTKILAEKKSIADWLGSWSRVGDCIVTLMVGF